ncbi:MAG: ECF-type sigma factor [Pirellulales bacterium]
MQSEFSTLLDRIKAGDPQAVREFVDRYESFLRRTIRYRIDRVGLQAAFDSKDVCQSVLGSFFLRFLAGDFVLESDEAVRNLLVAMTNKKFLMFQRREYADKRDRRRTTSIGENEPLDNNQIPPNEQLGHVEIIQRFEKSLNDDERRLYQMRQAGMQWEEIGLELNESPATLRQRLSRAARRVALDLGFDDE